MLLNFLRKLMPNMNKTVADGINPTSGVRDGMNDAKNDQVSMKKKSNSKMNVPPASPSQIENVNIKCEKCSSHSKIYSFICSSFLCMFILSFLLITYVNKKTHVSVIENNNKNKKESLYAKNEIEMIVKNYLNDNYGSLKYRDNDIR